MSIKSAAPIVRQTKQSPTPGMALISLNAEGVSNIQSIREALSTHMLSKHGDIAQLIETLSEFVEPEIVIPERIV